MAEYYYTRNRKVRGPIPLEQIVKYVKARKLPPETQVCMAGKKEWKAIGSVAPDVANLASNAKIVGWTIGGAAGLIGVIMTLMWLLSGGDKGVEGTGAGVAGGGTTEPEVHEQIVSEFTVTPGKRRIQEVKMEGELMKVLIMDVELQSPNPVQVALTPKNLYVTGTGKRILDKSEKFYVAPKQAEYEMVTESEVKHLAMGTSSLVGFDDGEMNLMLEGVRKYKISLMFFDPPGEDVVLHFPPSQPWGGPEVADNGGGGQRPAGGDDNGNDGGGSNGGGSNGGGKKEEETIVVGNVPEDFAFMPLSKVKDGDISDIKEVLAGVADMKIEFKVDTPEEAQVALVSGDDVVTGLYGEGLRLFPVEAGAAVTMWITEPFAAYRKGTLIAVYDPSKEKFRYPREEDGVPDKIAAPAATTPADGGTEPAMTPDGTPEMKPEMTAPGADAEMEMEKKPEMIEGAAGGAAMAPEMKEE